MIYTSYLVYALVAPKEPPKSAAAPKSDKAPAKSKRA